MGPCHEKTSVTLDQPRPAAFRSLLRHWSVLGATTLQARLASGRGRVAWCMHGARATAHGRCNPAPGAHQPWLPGSQRVAACSGCRQSWACGLPCVCVCCAYMTRTFLSHCCAAHRRPLSAPSARHRPIGGACAWSVSSLRGAGTGELPPERRSHTIQIRLRAPSIRLTVAMRCS